MHSLPGFSSRSRSLPLSARLVKEEPLDDRGRAIEMVLTLGGDVDSGFCEGAVFIGYEGVGDGDEEDAATEDVGRDRRYQPPV